jgi:hypothetical protein
MTAARAPGTKTRAQTVELFGLEAGQPETRRAESPGRGFLTRGCEYAVIPFEVTLDDLGLHFGLEWEKLDVGINYCSAPTVVSLSSSMETQCPV